MQPNAKNTQMLIIFVLAAFLAAILDVRFVSAKVVNVFIIEITKKTKHKKAIVVQTNGLRLSITLTSISFHLIQKN